MLGLRQQDQLGGPRAGREAQEGGGGQADRHEEAGRDDPEEHSGRETLPPEDGGGSSPGLQGQGHQDQQRLHS